MRIDYFRLPQPEQAAFAALDPNRSGTITKTELDAMDTQTRQKLDQALAALDPTKKKLVESGITVRRVPVDGLNSMPDKGFKKWGTDQLINANRAYEPALNITGTPGETKPQRGYMEFDVQPARDGFNATIDVYTQSAQDKLDIVLYGQVWDPDAHTLTAVPLAVVAAQEALPEYTKGENATPYRRQVRAHITLDDLNKFFADAGAPLNVVPGVTPLFFAAQWSESGHRAGGPNRGRFIVPKPLHSTVGIQAAANTQLVTAKTGPLELDKAAEYSPRLLRTGWDAYKVESKTVADFLPATNPDGGKAAVYSRLETEYKGAASEADGSKALDRLYNVAMKLVSPDAKVVAEGKAESAKIFGDGFEIKPYTRFWEKFDPAQHKPEEEGKDLFAGFRVDPQTGRPVPSPMHDVYLDTANMAITRSGSAIRIRSDENKTVINIKDPGRAEPQTGIRHRVEASMDAKGGMDAKKFAHLMRLLDNDSPENPWKNTIYNYLSNFARSVDPSIDLKQELTPVFEVVQERHKFHIKNPQTNFEQEVSLDFVTVKTMRPEHEVNGQPQEVKFFIVEGELNHLQTTSTNSMAAPENRGTSVGIMTQDDLDKFLPTVGPNATLNVDQQLHSRDDVSDPRLKNDPDQIVNRGITLAWQNYAFTDESGNSLLKPASQKAHHAGVLMGIVNTQLA